jgi:hypothetical protein
MKQMQRMGSPSRELKVNGTKQIFMKLFLAAAFVASQQALMAAGPAPVNLGSAGQFVILSGSGITTAGQPYTINGNAGTSPAAGSYEIDLVQAQVNGIIYEVSAGGPAGAVVDPTLLTAATGDQTAAYNDAAGRTSTPAAPVILNPGAAGNIAGLTLAPGLYQFTTSPASISGSSVTLSGGPNDVWIFQVAAGLTVNNSVILAGGAQAGNIFWQVGTSVAIGTGVAFQGTILADAAVTMASTSTLVGRALAETAVTFDGSSANLPAPVSNGTEGSLRVAISPTAAVVAGAEWQVENGPDQPSGATVSNLSAGTYTVSFTPISGWNTPVEQTVIITTGAITVAGGLYIPSITPTNGLILLTNGDGIIQHAVWPANLVIGNKYTVTAVPAAKNLFSNWVGGVTQPYTVLSTSARYTFTMVSNLLLEANFVTNPFIPVTGLYNGLFFMTNGVTEQTAGMLRGLLVRQNGTYIGTLLIDGQSRVFSGRFNLSGQATNKILREVSQGNLLLELTLNWNNSPPQVTGTVYGTNNGVAWMATNLIADFATNNMPSAELTMLLPPDTNNAPPNLSPGGDGYALITNNATTVKITGALADGTAFNQSVPISQDGFVPVYANLYGGKGLFMGWINLNLTNTNNIAFTGLTWIHPARPFGLYQNGFTNVLYTNQILLSSWTNPPVDLGLLTNLSILDTINNTNTRLTNIAVNISDLDKVTGTSVTGFITPKTGFFKVIIGSGSSQLTGYGAILPNATNAGGYYLTKTNNAQAIQITP